MLSAYFSERDKMAEEENVPIEPVVEEEEESTSYKPPPEKSLQEMIETDKEDESLRKYKETLLGSSAAGAVVVGMFVDWFIFCPAKWSLSLYLIGACSFV